ncbi:MAG: GHMP kinase [Bdellovibrio sp.]
MKVSEKLGSVRVDLLGGTIDLNPINLILPNVVTLNVATSLKAKAKISAIQKSGVVIKSLDYNRVAYFPSEDFTLEKLRGAHFKELSFVAQILHHFGLHNGIEVELASGSPPGAGLGGSSAMGVTLYSALCDFTGRSLDRLQAIKVVNSIEARILDSGPAGYQDYYPALFGGVLALVAEEEKVQVEQHYSEELAQTLESHLTLVYSGQERLSGINNWEVYKGFFDRNPKMREGLSIIAKLSHQAHLAMKEKKFLQLVELIAQEGAARKDLFPGIVSGPMHDLYDTIKKEVPTLGLKVCGAGGGGCFLLTHSPEKRNVIQSYVSDHKMQILDFKVVPPLSL